MPYNIQLYYDNEINWTFTNLIILFFIFVKTNESNDYEAIILYKLIVEYFLYKIYKIQFLNVSN